MKKLLTAAVLLLALCLAACGAQASPAPAEPTPQAVPSAAPITHQPEVEAPAKEEEPMLQLWIDDTAVAVTWEDNESVSALRELCREEPLTISLSMYGGFEQVGPLGTSLPRSDRQTTTAAGDIVLYAGNQIVVFYGSNSWAYTRLGRITDPGAEDLAALLGRGDVSLTLGLEGQG